MSTVTIGTGVALTPRQLQAIAERKEEAAKEEVDNKAAKQAAKQHRREEQETAAATKAAKKAEREARRAAAATTAAASVTTAAVATYPDGYEHVSAMDNLLSLGGAPAVLATYHGAAVPAKKAAKVMKPKATPKRKPAVGEEELSDMEKLRRQVCLVCVAVEIPTGSQNKKRRQAQSLI